MSLVEYAEFLVKNVAKNADLVKVKDFHTEEGTIIEILVSEEDLPAVIGRQGKLAKSIKTLVRIKAHQENVENIKINIDSF